MKNKFIVIINILTLIFVLGCDPLSNLDNTTNPNTNTNTNNTGNNNWNNTWNTTGNNTGNTYNTSTVYTYNTPAVGGTTNNATLIIPTATIVVDGNTADWNNITPMATDMQGDNMRYLMGSDLKALYLAKDNENLYLRLDLWEYTNQNFGNAPVPLNGSYRFYIHSNSYNNGGLGLGVAYGSDPSKGYYGKWSLGHNGANSPSAPYQLQGPAFVGVMQNVIEIKIPLIYISYPTDYYGVGATTNDFGTILDAVSAGSI